jgi:hypothetical protein
MDNKDMLSLSPPQRQQKPAPTTPTTVRDNNSPSLQSFAPPQTPTLSTPMTPLSSSFPSYPSLSPSSFSPSAPAVLYFNTMGADVPKYDPSTPTPSLVSLEDKLEKKRQKIKQLKKKLEAANGIDKEKSKFEQQIQQVKREMQNQFDKFMQEQQVSQLFIRVNFFETHVKTERSSPIPKTNFRIGV